MDASNCRKIIRELLDIDVLGIVSPMFDAPKRTTYFVKDHMYAFDEEILRRRRLLISSADESGITKLLNLHLRTYFGRRFELVCMDHLLKTRNVLDIGKWWYGGKSDPSEIDIVATVSEDGIRYDVFCECKFKEEPVGFSEYNKLDDKARRFAESSNMRLMMFSSSGFEENLIGFAKDSNVILVGLDELFGRRSPEKLF